MAEPLTDTELKHIRACHYYPDGVMNATGASPIGQTTLALLDEIDRLRSEAIDRAGAFVAVVRQRDAAEKEVRQLRAEVAELRRAVADAEDGGEEVS